MFVLTIDFGNTTIKAALFEDEQLLEMRYSLSITDLEDWIIKIKNHSSIVLEGIMMSSVRKNEEIELSFVKNLNKKLIHLSFDNSQLIIKSSLESKQVATESEENSVVLKVIFLDENTLLPIQNNYKTPKTLGKDRLAAVIGAYFLQKEVIKKPTLVIDAGTCITFDFIDTDSLISKGIYRGGSISLGLQMRFKALNHFTAKLPLFRPNEKLPNPVGKTTEEAMQSGVQFGLISEIKGVIDFYQNQQNQISSKKNKENKLNVVICGGDAELLTKWWEEYLIDYLFHIDNSHTYQKWTIEPNLVLIGLQRIFQFIKHNEDN